MNVRNKFKLIIYFLILVLISSLIYPITLVYADSFNNASDQYSDTVYNVHGDSFNVPGVKQSTNQNSITTFGSALPLATIDLDHSKIGEDKGEFKILTKDPRIAPGIGIISNTGMGTDPDINRVYYDPTVDPDNLIQLYPNMDNVLTGDLFSFTFKDAAILSNGTRANLKITYSNVHFYIDQRYTGIGENGEDGKYNGKAYISIGGVKAYYSGTDDTNLTPYNSSVTGSSDIPISGYVNNNTTRYPSIGSDMEIAIEIVDDNDNKINGTFPFGIYGINIDRIGTSITKVIQPLLYMHDIVPEFQSDKESADIKQGIVSENVYVRPNTKVRPDSETNTGYFYPKVIGTNDVIKFIASSENISQDIQNDNTEYTIAKQGSNSEFSTGFITLGDANGLKIKTYGQGGYVAVSTMATTILPEISIFHTITSSSGTGGTIKTTDEGNYNGDLSDGNILGSGTYGVANGKTVTYTITPKNGYRLKNVTVDGNTVNIPLGNNAIENISIAENITGKLTNKGNGVYTFEFPTNNADHTIHVDWDADHYFIKNWIPKDTTSLTLKAKAYTFDGISLVYTGASNDVTFTVNKTDSNVIEKNTITGGTQWVIKKTDLPIEPANSVHTADHDNPYYWFITEENAPTDYTLDQYDNSAITHTNYYDKASINAAWQTAVRGTPTGAYASIVRECGVITNIIYKELTVSKTVTGNLADTDKEFAYTITIYNGDIPITDELTINKNGTSISIANGATFTLKHGETATIGNIIQGYKYTIEEANTEYAEGYKIEKTEDNSTIVAQTEGTTITKQSLNENQTITYTNNKSSSVLTGVTTNTNPYIIMVTTVIALMLCYGGAIVVYNNFRKNRHTGKRYR